MQTANLMLYSAQTVKNYKSWWNCPD